MAVISDNQDKFLQPLDGSRRLNKDVFPIKRIVSSVIQGFKQIVNENGTRPKGCYGKWAWDMFRASIGGCLERTAIIFTRSGDHFHIDELQGGNAQITDFSECYQNPPQIIREARNDLISTKTKRRWRIDRLMSDFVSWCSYLAHCDYRSNDNGSWFIIPPILTTAYSASGLFAKDLDNSNELLDTSTAAAKFGGSEGLQKYPAGSDGEDGLINVLSRNELYFDVPSERVNGKYPYAEEYCASERDIVFGSFLNPYCRRRSGSRMAGALNFMDLMRIGCWVGDAASDGDIPRVNYRSEIWKRNISITADWNLSEGDFDVSVSADSAYQDSVQVGRYARFSYSEPMNGGTNGFANTKWASIQETLYNALRDYYDDPIGNAWMAGYFTLEESRTIPQTAEYWKGWNGTLIWFEAPALYNFLQQLLVEGYTMQEDETMSGGVNFHKEMEGEWTDSDGEYGSSYFGDIDYPCSYAINEQYVSGSQEYMFGIGRLDVEVYGSERTYYDALKGDGGKVIEHRTRAASTINEKFINDCFNILSKEAGGNIVSTKQEMIDWMNGFKFAPNPSSPAYDEETLRTALLEAKETAEWNFIERFFCVAGANLGANKFDGFAGFFGASEAGASDLNMRAIYPRDSESDVYAMYRLAEKSFVAPLWYRGNDKVDFSAKGEIESWIGAFDWEWKSITHD